MSTRKGRLFHTERGLALHSHNEELSRWRWAKKVLSLPAEACVDADLHILARSYPGNAFPLIVEVNGQLVGEVAPEGFAEDIWGWHRVAVRTGVLREGDNEIVLRCENPAMTSWVLGIEPQGNPHSYLSYDRGETWQNHTMGVHNVMRGEYVVRLRTHNSEVHQPDAPPIMYEDPEHPRVKELAAWLPDHVKAINDPWKQILALRTWVAQQWMHGTSGRANYAPWDPWTIANWALNEWGHGSAGRIAFCVHFGAFMAVAAASLGHKARAIVVTSSVNSGAGHFMCEVWDEGKHQWVLHDANYDLHYELEGRALSAFDIADCAHRKQSLIGKYVKGPGFPAQVRRLTNGLDKYFASPVSFTNTGVWTHNQYVSNPGVMPPNHGAITYAETDFIWYQPGDMAGTDMFPYRTASRDPLDAPPEAEWDEVEQGAAQAAK